MSSFYGESWSLDYASSTTVSITNGGLDMQKHFDGQSRVLSAGQSIIAAIYPSALELTRTDSAVISWVVETGPATAGTLRLSSGLDPNFYTTDPAFATEALGQFPVTGTATVVAGPVTGIHVSDLFGFNSEPAVYLEVVSGTVEVVQVKLRIWPPGGPAGAWGPAPSFEDYGNPRLFTSQSTAIGGTPEVPQSAESAWAVGRASFDSFVEGVTTVPDGAPLQFSEVGATSSGMTFWLDAGGGLRWCHINAWYSVCAAVMHEVRFSLEYAGTDPREVTGDRAEARSLDGGPLMTEFNGWMPGSLAHIDDAGFVVWEEYTKDWLDELVYAGGNSNIYTAPARRPTGTVVEYQGAAEFDLPPWPCFAMGVLASNYFAFTTEDLWDSSGGIDKPISGYTHVVARLIVPPHERFNSALPWVDDTPPPPPDVPPPPAAQPGAGYYVIPSPNLGGGLDGVAVHFTSI